MCLKTLIPEKNTVYYKIPIAVFSCILAWHVVTVWKYRPVLAECMSGIFFIRTVRYVQTARRTEKEDFTDD